MNVWERIDKKVQQDGDCWRWTAARDTTGYGRIVYERKLWPAHRLVYTLLVGEVPRGLVLDHLCRNRWCVNPYHLDPVTDAVNFSRAPDPNRRKKEQSHCKNGHPFEGRNLIMRRNGCRDCRACGLEQARRYQAKKKAVA